MVITLQPTSAGKKQSFLSKIISRGKGAKARMRAPETPERRKARVKAAGIVAAGVGVATLGAGAGPLAAIAGKGLLGAGVVAAAAPETVSRVLSIKGAPEIIAAGAVAGPVGALAVGSEKGSSILGDILGNLPEIVEEHKGEIAAAGVGVAAVLGIPPLVRAGKEKVEEFFGSDAGMLEDIPNAAPAGPLGSGPMQPIPPATEEITTEKKKSKSRRRSRAQFPSQIISQNVKVMVENKTNKFIKRAVYV